MPYREAKGKHETRAYQWGLLLAFAVHALVFAVAYALVGWWALAITALTFTTITAGVYRYVRESLDASQSKQST